MVEVLAPVPLPLPLLWGDPMDVVVAFRLGVPKYIVCLLNLDELLLRLRALVAVRVPLHGQLLVGLLDLLL